MTILRNLNQQFGGRRILGTPHVGWLGSLVAGQGFSGPGILYNDVQQYGLQANYVRAEILTHNLPAGTFFVYEDGSFTVTGAPDGAYRAFYRLWIDGRPSSLDQGYGPGVGVINITIGNAIAVPVPTIVPYEVFLTHILPMIPGCPDDVVVMHARQASIEFFSKTHAWRSTLPNVVAVSGYSEYPLPLPSQGAVAKLLAYRINGSPAAVASFSDGQMLNAYDSSEDIVWTATLTTFNVSPPPASGDTMSLDVALKPTQASTGIFEFLWEQYADALYSGALARLYAMPNQPWTDIARASDARQAFMAAIASAGAAASRSGASSMRVRAHFY